MYPVISSSQERSIAGWCHYGALFGLVLPYANIWVPLIIWMANRGKSSLVDDQGKESLNYQITLSIFATVVGVVGWILTHIFLGGIAWLLGLIMFLGVFVMPILAGMRASIGRRWRYPFRYRFIQ